MSALKLCKMFSFRFREAFTLPKLFYINEKYFFLTSEKIRVRILQIKKTNYFAKLCAKVLNLIKASVILKYFDILIFSFWCILTSVYSPSITTAPPLARRISFTTMGVGPGWKRILKKNIMFELYYTPNASCIMCFCKTKFLRMCCRIK